MKGESLCPSNVYSSAITDVCTVNYVFFVTIKTEMSCEMLAFSLCLRAYFILVINSKS